MEKNTMHDDLAHDEDILDDDSFETDEGGDGPCDMATSCEDVDDI